MRNNYPDNTCQTHTLSNGLRLIFRPTASPVAYCGFAIDAGTRDEDEQQPGMAHFVEHLLFKGTQKRRAYHILNRMENVGGELNAYTNKEETMVYAIFLRQHLSRALELLTDIVFSSTFPEREVERETEVIVDEIRSYEDEPSELIFDEFEARLFGTHPLGRNILGDEASLRKFTGNDAATFVRKHYVTGNMALFVQADVDFREVVRLTERVVGPIPRGEAQNGRTAPNDFPVEDLTLHRDTHQAHVMIGGRAYAADDRRRTALYLLNNILGGPGMNSRLNVALREKRGLVYNVESNLTSYTDTGVFSIYFGCDQADVDRCLRYTFGELSRLRNNRLTTNRLSAAKKQLIGQIGVAADNHENNVLGMAKAFLHYNRWETPAEVYLRIHALTADDLLDVAGDMFDPQRLTMLAYV